MLPSMIAQGAELAQLAHLALPAFDAVAHTLPVQSFADIAGQIPTAADVAQKAFAGLQDIVNGGGAQKLAPMADVGWGDSVTPTTKDPSLTGCAAEVGFGIGAVFLVAWLGLNMSTGK